MALQKLTITLSHTITEIFGASDGRPRFGFDQWTQVRGYSDAITHILNLPGIDTDQVVVWGESMGGANVQYVAAFDSRVSR